MSGESYTTLRVTRPRDYVVKVEINRPAKRNAITLALFREIGHCFEKLDNASDCRAIILCGAGAVFCAVILRRYTCMRQVIVLPHWNDPVAGIDFTTASEIASYGESEPDVARRAFRLNTSIREVQSCFSAIEKCSKPVLVAIHSACLGVAIDLCSWCDIRYCSEDAWFSIKEVDIGAVSDMGGLQRFPKITGNDSLAREMTYTTNTFNAKEAKAMGFVSRILPDQSSLIEAALDTASVIATKSPIAVQGSKISMVYSRDNTVAEGLDHIAIWNQSMLQSHDMREAARAAMTKGKPKFSKL